jgi:hypothetical protein
MAKDTKLAIGQESPNPGCLAAIPTGVAQYVRSLDSPGDVINHLFHRASSKLLAYREPPEVLSILW